MNIGRFNEALSDFNRALELAPQFADALRGRAYVRGSLGDFEAALHDCNSVLEIIPENGDAWFVRGTANLATEHHNEALNDFSKAIECETNSASVYRDRGLAQLLAEDFDAAFEDTQHALQLDPGDFIAFNNRGAILAKQGRYVEAVNDFQASLAIQPNFANPYRHLAWIRATCPDDSLRDGKQAVADSTRALEMTEWKQLEWLEVLAAANAEAGDFEAACKWQQQWLESAPPQQLAETQSRLDLYQANLPFRDTPYVAWPS